MHPVHYAEDHVVYGWGSDFSNNKGFCSGPAPINGKKGDRFYYRGFLHEVRADEEVQVEHSRL